MVQLGLGLMLFMMAVPCLSSAEITLFSILEIIFSVDSTWVLIGEQPAKATLVGGGIVVAALAASQIAGLRQPRAANS